jgi:surfeit locus 1 family protein
VRRRRGVAVAAALAAVAVLLALGIWQVERRAWKHALVAQVERRLAAAPVTAPGPAAWRTIDAGDAYTRVRADGRYRARADVLVQAVTALGGGYWVVTPFDTAAGWTVLVNRGFVPAAERARIAPPSARFVTGLLRVSEPGGAFLRSNDPAAGRWYSRDVAAIARAGGLGDAAPYFIDADAAGAGWPRGGMTVVRFADNHLVYALTWFALAALVAILAWRALRREGAA